MRQTRFFPSILSVLLLLPFSGLQAQDLTEDDREAIQAVWSELDDALLQHDLDRLMEVYADGAIETFNEESVQIGPSAVRERLASVLERLEVKVHRSQVDAAAGRRGVAVAWVSNTQTHINREDGTETTYDIDFAAVMRKEANGAWKIAYYELVWPEM